MKATIVVAALVLLSCVHAHVETAGAKANATDKAKRWVKWPHVKMYVQQPAQFHRDATVQVSWSLSDGNYREGDWVSVWWEPFAAAYVQYANVTSNQGTATFKLINARFPYVFRYYRGDDMVHQSETKVIPNALYPMQIRTVFNTNDVGSVKIMWTTNKTQGAANIVQYGTSPDFLTNTATEIKSMTYTQQDLNTKVGLPTILPRTKPFWNIGEHTLRCKFGTCYNDQTALELYVDPGVFHVVEISGLQPNSIYYFSVGQTGGLMSSVRQFRTRMAPGSHETLNILYTADAGAGYIQGQYRGSATHNADKVASVGGRTVWDLMKADPLTAETHSIIMNGDLSYARGWPMIWEAYHYEVEDLFGQVPVMAQYGNHEYDWTGNPYSLLRGQDSGGECGIPTQRRFDLHPTTPWYMMSMGPATFIALSSEHSVSAQAAWLAQTLPTIDRTSMPWLVVFLHRPLYESNTWYSAAQVNDMIDNYTDLFMQYNVDLVLTGHAHYYERMCAISNSECDTWNFRDVWTKKANTAVSGYGSCSTELTNTTLYPCRAQCAKTAGCTGVMVNSAAKTCYILTCETFTVQQNSEFDSWKMSREPGQAPVYIVDGTGGGAFTPLHTPFNPMTEYKDFQHWGYSRMKMSRTQLTWNHYHVDMQVYDTLTLNK